MDNEKKPRLGPEAPGWKDFVIVLLAAALLIGLSWIAWFKFGWFH
jgi:hypothetical protein